MKRWLLLLPVAAGLALAQDVKPRRNLIMPAKPGRPSITPAPGAQSNPVAPNPTGSNPKEKADASPPATAPSPAPQAAPAAAPTTAAVKPSDAKPATPVPDNAIPKAYSEEHYAASWRRNPFLIETKAHDAAPGPSFADDWELKGLTKVKGEPQAMLSNKKTQEYHWVKTTEDKDGFKLLEAKFDRDIHKQSVKVAKSGDPNPATFTFPEVAAAAGPGIGAKGAPMPGVAPRPGVPPAVNPAMRTGAAQGPTNPNYRPGVPTQQAGGIPRPNMPNGAPGAQPTPNGRRRTLLPPQPIPAQPGT